jgi:hypothetical protein
MGQRMGQQLVDTEQRMGQRMGQQLVDTEQRLMAELGRYTKASEEELTTRVAVIDEKYADLPRRVKLLEGAVFPAKKR